MKQWQDIAATGLVALALSQYAHGSVLREGACAPTAEAAVSRYLSQTEGAGTGEGFRVVSTRRDSLRAKTWALVERCNHPDAPLLTFAVAAKDDPAVRPSVTVHVGDLVMVLRSNGASRMELTGWAEEGGSLGARIRVRLPKLSDVEDGPAPHITCMVTGQAQVEVLQ